MDELEREADIARRAMCDYTEAEETPDRTDIRCAQCLANVSPNTLVSCEPGCPNLESE